MIYYQIVTWTAFAILAMFLKSQFVGTVIIIKWGSVQDTAIIRKTWEQVSNPEPLWEIYHEPWNRVSGLYAAISTLEPWEG